MNIIKKIILIFAATLTAATAVLIQAGNSTNTYPDFIFDESTLNPVSTIKAECKHLSLDKSIKQQTIAEVPPEAFMKKETGYAVFDFQIDKNGNVINIELASKDSKKYFVRSANKILKKLKFSINDEWITNCSDQTYRIGYAFRIMSECTYHEFPAPIINACSQGVVEKITTHIN